MKLIDDLATSISFALAAMLQEPPRQPLGIYPERKPPLLPCNYLAGLRIPGH